MAVSLQPFLLRAALFGAFRQSQAQRSQKARVFDQKEGKKKKLRDGSKPAQTLSRVARRRARVAPTHVYTARGALADTHASAAPTAGPTLSCLEQMTQGLGRRIFGLFSRAWGNHFSAARSRRAAGRRGGLNQPDDAETSSLDGKRRRSGFACFYRHSKTDARLAPRERSAVERFFEHTDCR